MTQLVLRGKVTKLEPVKSPDRRRRWLVTLQVNSVDSGTFTGDSFSFLVHSPSKSGLSVGGSYTVRAEATSNGEYQVNQWQWLED